MTEPAVPSQQAVQDDLRDGVQAARLIWNDDAAAESIHDPRTPEFARAMIEESVVILNGSSGLIKKMIKRATAGAEDLAVGQFQGLIEVIQNADDVGAKEVRFALRTISGCQQLLVVHDGQPVTCHHVLPMALPFLTTKTGRTDQRGRFGIGLKTLRRIAKSTAVHSAPYHFSGDQLGFGWVEPQPLLSGFYDPDVDTLLVLSLHDDFNEAALKQWFEEWDDDGLLFLESVRRFRWAHLNGQTISERSLTFSAWKEAGYSNLHGDLLGLKKRDVSSPQHSWTVWKAALSVPGHLHPAHKARSDTTEISVAASADGAPPEFYIGFKTLIPIGVPFSLDAQFDPSTSREGMIENPWNNWLIERCADVLADIASGLLATSPASAWQLIALDTEEIGRPGDHWLRGRFSAAFEAMRVLLTESALVSIGSSATSFAEIAYEEESWSGLLTDADTEMLAPSFRTLTRKARDVKERWRTILDLLDVSRLVDSADVLQGFDGGLFAEKSPTWWVDAGALLTMVSEELFGHTFLLSDNGGALTCQPTGATERPIVWNAKPSSFGARWKLLELLHHAYGQSDAGQKVLAWLTAHAAFRSELDAEVELAAFAEKFATEPLAIDDDDLRELRARFDSVTDRRAETLGPKVGASILLDGYTHKNRKTQRLKVSPAHAYLCRTLDGESPHWPQAAGSTPGILWIAAKYADVLKTEAIRGAKRRRADGSVVRGPRRMLMLLGVEAAPRLSETGRVRWGSGARLAELGAVGAEEVEYDYVSQDLEAVLKDLLKAPKKDAKVRSPALLRTLSRSWERLYEGRETVPARHKAIKHTYDRGPVTATWLNELRESPWLAIGKGELVQPVQGVVRTVETQTLYDKFLYDIGPDEIDARLAVALKLVTDVRIGDLVSHLEELRDRPEPVDEAHVMQVYRTISQRCPRTVSYDAQVGEISVQDLRGRFLLGPGLILASDGQWRRHNEMLRGMDIFHHPRAFVPGGPACKDLWLALAVREPDLDDCIQFCRNLTSARYDSGVASALMDVYRYLERLVSGAQRRHKDRLKSMPLMCSEAWTTSRPVYFVEDIELRQELTRANSTTLFWSPPCDPRDFPHLVRLMGITRLAPELSIMSRRVEAIERGESLHLRFSHAVDHLSGELARSDPITRAKIAVSWDQLRNAPLLVYEQAIRVRASDPLLPTHDNAIFMRALVLRDPLEVNVRDDDIGDREYGGRAIASLFPPEVRRRIDAEWVLAWQKSRDTAAEAISLASDEERDEAMQEQAATINAGPKSKIRVTPPASQTPSQTPPRTLKESVGAVTGATVQPGQVSSQASISHSGAGLRAEPPQPSPPIGSSAPTRPIAYTAVDVEQRGWELLVQTLEMSPEDKLVDFRKRHGVGADGVIDWKRFVEMKASARGPQTQVEMSNNEYERAKERGSDFILALVSGLETGLRDEVRLIFDPANCTTVRPTNGVRLVDLLNAPAVVIHFDQAEDGAPSG